MSAAQPTPDPATGDADRAELEYRVKLDIFSGPLDLLLFLVKRHELAIEDVALAKITDQYLTYVKLLEQIDPNAVGDFLVVAATLAELKSRALLPVPPVEMVDEDEEFHSTLVQELLEYKRFKDAAARLGSAADERAKRFVHKPANLPPELDGVELEDVELWDLVNAFSRVMNAIGQGPARHEVTYDDTPIELYASEIVEVLERDGAQTLQQLFGERTTRAELIGLFLATLELVKQHRVQAKQPANFDAIYLVLLDTVEELGEDDQFSSETPAAEEGESHAGTK